METIIKARRRNFPRIEMPKRCAGCGDVKPSSQFYSTPSQKSGLNSRCIPCVAIKDREPRNRFSRARGSAKGYGEVWTLGIEEYLELIQKPCDYCGWEIEGQGRGIDRMDNAKGYISGNCTPACGLCNSMKGNAVSYLEQKTIMGPAVRLLRLGRLALGLPQPDRMVMPKSPLGQGEKKRLMKGSVENG